MLRQSGMRLSAPRRTATKTPAAEGRTGSVEPMDTLTRAITFRAPTRCSGRSAPMHLATLPGKPVTVSGRPAPRKTGMAPMMTSPMARSAGRTAARCEGAKARRGEACLGLQHGQDGTVRERHGPSAKVAARHHRGAGEQGERGPSEGDREGRRPYRARPGDERDLPGRSHRTHGGRQAGCRKPDRGMGYEVPGKERRSEAR